MSLCICVVLSWNELKVRQNLLASDCEIHMACLLVAVYWHKLLQFVKKSLTLHSELVYLWFISCFYDHIMLYYIPARFEFQFIYLLHLIIYISCMISVTLTNSKMNQPPKYQEMVFFFLFAWFLKNLSGITAFRKIKCPDPSMIPLSAEVREWLQNSIWLTSYTLI